MAAELYTLQQKYRGFIDDVIIPAYVKLCVFNDLHKSTSEESFDLRNVKIPPKYVKLFYNELFNDRCVSQELQKIGIKAIICPGVGYSIFHPELLRTYDLQIEIILNKDIDMTSYINVNTLESLKKKYIRNLLN